MIPPKVSSPLGSVAHPPPRNHYPALLDERGQGAGYASISDTAKLRPLTARPEITLGEDLGPADQHWLMQEMIVKLDDQIHRESQSFEQCDRIVDQLLPVQMGANMPQPPFVTCQRCLASDEATEGITRPNAACRSVEGILQEVIRTADDVCVENHTGFLLAEGTVIMTMAVRRFGERSLGCKLEWRASTFAEGSPATHFVYELIIGLIVHISERWRPIFTLTVP